MSRYILFIGGFLLLFQGANLLVDSALSIARRLKVSDLVIGLTIVAFGTSVPELLVNIIASIKGNTDIAIGNVIGSNIANILLILGISSLVCPLTVKKGTVWKEIPFGLLAAVLIGVMVNDRLIDNDSSSTLTKIDGLIFLSFFIIFIYYLSSIAHRIEVIEEGVQEKQFGLAKSFLSIIIGLVFLVLGGKWVVEGAVYLALRLGVSQSLIGLTIVAVGTSLPELATSVVAAFKKNSEIAIGNIVGSNIFNIFFILGISSVIRPLPLQPYINTDILILIFANVLLFIYMFTGRRHTLDRIEGFIFVIMYIYYVSFLVIRG